MVEENRQYIKTGDIRNISMALLTSMSSLPVTFAAAEHGLTIVGSCIVSFCRISFRKESLDC